MPNSSTSSSLGKALKDTTSRFGPLEKITRDAGERAGEAVSHFASSAKQYYDGSREYVKSNPVKGVAIAAAAGLVTGGLLSLALRRNGT